MFEMATEIVFDKDHSLFVDHPIQEVYDGLTEAHEGGTLVTFIASEQERGASTKRVDVCPGSVRYLLERNPPSKGVASF